MQPASFKTPVTHVALQAPPPGLFVELPVSAAAATLVRKKPTQRKKSKQVSTNGGKVTLLEWLDANEERAVLRPDDPIFVKLKKTNIDADWVHMAWMEFKEKFVDQPETKYSNWLAAFRNYAKNNWLKLWSIHPDGGVSLTDGGVVALANFYADNPMAVAPLKANETKTVDSTQDTAIKESSLSPQQWDGLRANIHQSMSCFERSKNTVSQLKNKKQGIYSRFGGSIFVPLDGDGIDFLEKKAGSGQNPNFEKGSNHSLEIAV